MLDVRPSLLTERRQRIIGGMVVGWIVVCIFFVNKRFLSQAGLYQIRQYVPPVPDLGIFNKRTRDFLYSKNRELNDGNRAIYLLVNTYVYIL